MIRDISGMNLDCSKVRLSTGKSDGASASRRLESRVESRTVFFINYPFEKNILV
jgi:hypothetical protein